MKYILKKSEEKMYIYLYIYTHTHKDNHQSMSCHSENSYTLKSPKTIKH